MFIQTLTLHAPSASQKDLKKLVEEIFLPAARRCDGFLSALLEGEKLIINWTSQQACKAANQSLALIGAYLSMAASLPGLVIDKTSNQFELDASWIV
ncbi:MAG: hypothetical protein Kow00117_14140 [Phototrophicales bacterium]|nr:MAG: hypothetical protein CUN56_09125 [Phototrophicales bacterium]RMG69784.1 MAG: hypothetical protein D6711_18870 [Chloroflexota bacterium]